MIHTLEFRILQKVSDPCGSGSKTLTGTTGSQCCGSLPYQSDLGIGSESWLFKLPFRKFFQYKCKYCKYCKIKFMYT
jgi:hypothetical protein